ncbi:MAG: hypothetical protein V2I33_23495, partial [Kangiellaceae bacterium]|nr:hypothetical protein [Kangiellaceae bacterium]
MKAKHDELKEMIEEALGREKELESREHAVEDAFEKLSQLYTRMTTVNDTKPWIPETERDEAFSHINETITWIEDKVIEQAGVPLHEKPILTSKKINKKVGSVEKKIEKMERRKEPKDKDKDKDKKKKSSSSDLPPDFINFGGGDGSNIKFDNVK